MESEKSILKTLVYYDCLDCPLTFDELRKFLFQGTKEISDLEFWAALKSLFKSGFIEESGGFYFLKRRKELLEIRKERNKIAEKKWRKTLKAVRWLQMVPYLRMVFASGSLALNNTGQESDLDVLMVVKHGRIWTARFLTVILLSLLGMRRTRYEKTAPDKICLNHFITDKSLYIPRKSIYTAQLYARLVPILGDEKLIEKFCEANSWVGEYIPKFQIHPVVRQGAPSNDGANPKFRKFVKKSGEKILNTKIGDWLEKFFKKYQLRRIKNYHLTYKSGGRVKADDESLEFHPDSPELKIIERYNKTMVKLGFQELAKELDSGLLTETKS